MANIRWNPADYEKHSSQQQLWARELIRKLALRGDETLLDLGCGDGKVTAEIAAALPGGSILGVDLSPEMIALARQRYPASAVPNLRFQQEDAGRLPFDNQFEVVFSNAVLHWVRDHRPVLQGIRRGLKPGGKALLQMGGRDNGSEVFTCGDEVIRSPAWRAYFEDFTFPWSFYGPEEYEPWLREAGLQPLRVELLPKDMVHAGPLGFVGWLRTTWMPYTQRLPEDRREDFLDAVVRTYVAAHPADENGSVIVKMVRLEVEAVRP